jgi:phage-related protein
MQWEVEWLIDRSEKPASIPAYRFLKALPVNVRVQLLAILEAVRTVGPDQWADRQSHRPMKGDLADLHEVRDKQGGTLYRLFVLWQRKERRVVIIDGRKKPNKTALSEQEYDAVRSLAARVALARPPLASVDDFIQADLKT